MTRFNSLNIINRLSSTQRTEFKDKTILTVAHRLDTIIDYDRIIVMDNGHLVEDGSPAKLAMDPKSAFAKMIHDSKDAAGLIQAALK